MQAFPRFRPSSLAIMIAALCLQLNRSLAFMDFCYILLLFEIVAVSYILLLVPNMITISDWSLTSASASYIFGKSSKFDSKFQVIVFIIGICHGRQI